MYRTCTIIAASLLKFALVSILFFAWNGCDSILPEEFKEKEFNTIPAIDLRAYDLLSDSIDYSIQTRTVESLVDTATGRMFIEGSITENQIISANFNQIADSLQPQTLYEDSLIYVDTDQKSSYARLLSVPAGQSRNIYMYTGNSGSDAYVTIRLVRSDTLAVSYSEDMPMEVAYGRTRTITDGSEIKVVPIIGARYRFQINEGIYFVKFTMTNPQPFTIAILSF